MSNFKVKNEGKIFCQEALVIYFAFLREFEWQKQFYKTAFATQKTSPIAVGSAHYLFENSRILRFSRFSNLSKI
ncbi:MAG: hypothetical protein ACI9XO_002139 [Paraglaciecola sp.]|jgi:hypothetical protein